MRVGVIFQDLVCVCCEIAIGNRGSLVILFNRLLRNVRNLWVLIVCDTVDAYDVV